MLSTSLKSTIYKSRVCLQHTNQSANCGTPRVAPIEEAVKSKAPRRHREAKATASWVAVESVVVASAKPHRCLISARQSAEQELNRTTSRSVCPSAAPCSACTTGCSSGGWPPMATPPSSSSPATTASANTWSQRIPRELSGGSASGRSIADAPSPPPSLIRTPSASPLASYPRLVPAPGIKRIALAQSLKSRS